MKIERLKFDLSRDNATVLYEDGTAASMTIHDALLIWQQSRKQKGLRTPLSGISSMDDLLALLSSFSKSQKGNGKSGRG